MSWLTIIIIFSVCVVILFLELIYRYFEWKRDGWYMFFFALLSIYLVVQIVGGLLLLMFTGGEAAAGKTGVELLLNGYKWGAFDFLGDIFLGAANN